MPEPNTDPNHVSVRELYDLLDKSQDRMLKVIEQVEQRIATALAEHLRDHDARVNEPIEQRIAEHLKDHEGMVTGRRWMATTVIAVLGLAVSVVFAFFPPS